MFTLISDQYRTVTGDFTSHDMRTDWNELLVVVQQALRDSRTKQEFQRVLCVWLNVSFAMTSKQIALAIGLTPSSVRHIQARFSKDGIDCFRAKSRGGRRREHISWIRETQILNKFIRQAQRGAALDVKEIKRAYELSVGKIVAESTIYRLIQRHGLRKFLPRARRIS